MPAHKVSIIIVSYNSESFIEKCLESVLRNEPGAEVIVVDNASSDGTVNRVKSQESRVKIIENETNLGFAMANNLAAKMVSSEYLFFLNPDTEIKKPVLDELINFYENTPDAGLVAPRLIMADGKFQSSVRKLPTVWGAFKEYIFGAKNAYSEYIPGGLDPVEVEMVYGAAMLIKKDLFEKLGGFNEKYFLYYEDADLCNRLRKAGKKVYFYPGVSIIHLVGATTSEKDKHKLNYESSIKYHGTIQTIILNLIFRVARILR